MAGISYIQVSWDTPLCDLLTQTTAESIYQIQYQNQRRVQHSQSKCKVRTDSCWYCQRVDMGCYPPAIQYRRLRVWNIRPVLVCSGCNRSNFHVRRHRLQIEAECSCLPHLSRNHQDQIRNSDALCLHLFWTLDKHTCWEPTVAGWECSGDRADRHECVCCRILDSNRGLCICRPGRPESNVFV